MDFSFEYLGWNIWKLVSYGTFNLSLQLPHSNIQLRNNNIICALCTDTFIAFPHRNCMFLFIHLHILAAVMTELCHQLSLFFSDSGGHHSQVDVQYWDQWDCRSWGPNQQLSHSRAAALQPTVVTSTLCYMQCGVWDWLAAKTKESSFQDSVFLTIARGQIFKATISLSTRSSTPGDKFRLQMQLFSMWFTKSVASGTEFTQ